MISVVVPDVALPFSHTFKIDGQCMQHGKIIIQYAQAVIHCAGSWVILLHAFVSHSHSVSSLHCFVFDDLYYVFKRYFYFAPFLAFQRFYCICDVSDYSIV